MLAALLKQANIHHTECLDLEHITDSNSSKWKFAEILTKLGFPLTIRQPL